MYDRIENAFAGRGLPVTGWFAGQVLAPALLESGAVAGPLTMLLAWAFGLPLALGPPMLAAAAVPQLMWHLLHGRGEAFTKDKILITLLTANFIVWGHILFPGASPQKNLFTALLSAHVLVNALTTGRGELMRIFAEGFRRLNQPGNRGLLGLPPPVKWALASAGGGQHPLGEDEFSGDELEDLARRAEVMVRTGAGAADSEASAWAAPLADVLGSKKDGRKRDLLFRRAPPLREAFVKLNGYVNRKENKFMVEGKRYSVRIVKLDEPLRTARGREAPSFGRRDDEARTITLYVSSLSGVIHEMLEHVVLPAMGVPKNRRHVLSFFAEGLAGGEFVIAGGPGRAVLLPDRALTALDRLGGDPEARERFVRGYLPAGEQIKEKFPDPNDPVRRYAEDVAWVLHRRMGGTEGRLRRASPPPRNDAFRGSPWLEGSPEDQAIIEGNVRLLQAQYGDAFQRMMRGDGHLVLVSGVTDDRGRLTRGGSPFAAGLIPAGWGDNGTYDENDEDHRRGLWDALNEFHRQGCVTALGDIGKALEEGVPSGEESEDLLRRLGLLLEPVLRLYESWDGRVEEAYRGVLEAEGGDRFAGRLDILLRALRDAHGRALRRAEEEGWPAGSLDSLERLRDIFQKLRLAAMDRMASGPADNGAFGDLSPEQANQVLAGARLWKDAGLQGRIKSMLGGLPWAQWLWEAAARHPEAAALADVNRVRVLLDKLKLRFVESPTGLMAAGGRIGAGHYGFGGKADDRRPRFIYLSAASGDRELFSEKESAVIAAHELAHLLIKELNELGIMTSLRHDSKEAHALAEEIHRKAAALLFPGDADAADRRLTELTEGPSIAALRAVGPDPRALPAREKRRLLAALETAEKLGTISPWADLCLEALRGDMSPAVLGERWKELDAAVAALPEDKDLRVPSPGRGSVTFGPDGDPARVDGRYLILEPISKGSMSKVFLARDAVTGRLAAVKLSKHPVLRHVFRREYLTLCAAREGNPRAPRALSWGSSGDQEYFVMEYLGSDALDGLLGYGPPSVDRAVRVVRDLLLDVSGLHGAGFVHRDIKTENIFIGAGGRARLGDFGDAAARAAVRGAGHGFQDGSLADLSAVGLIVAEVFSRWGSGPPDAPGGGRNIPGPLRDFILAMNPLRPQDRRYVTAEAALEGLEAAVRESAFLEKVPAKGLGRPVAGKMRAGDKSLGELDVEACFPPVDGETIGAYAARLAAMAMRWEKVLKRRRALYEALDLQVPPSTSRIALLTAYYEADRDGLYLKWAAAAEERIKILTRGRTGRAERQFAAQFSGLFSLKHDYHLEKVLEIVNALAYWRGERLLPDDLRLEADRMLSRLVLLINGLSHGLVLYQDSVKGLSSADLPAGMLEAESGEKEFKAVQVIGAGFLPRRPGVDRAVPAKVRVEALPVDVPPQLIAGAVAAMRSKLLFPTAGGIARAVNLVVERGTERVLMKDGDPVRDDGTYAGHYLIRRVEVFFSRGGDLTFRIVKPGLAILPGWLLPGKWSFFLSPLWEEPFFREFLLGRLHFPGAALLVGTVFVALHYWSNRHEAEKAYAALLERNPALTKSFSPEERAGHRVRWIRRTMAARFVFQALGTLFLTALYKEGVPWWGLVLVHMGITWVMGWFGFRGLLSILPPSPLNEEAYDLARAVFVGFLRRGARAVGMDDALDGFAQVYVKKAMGRGGLVQAVHRLAEDWKAGDIDTTGIPPEKVEAVGAFLRAPEPLLKKALRAAAWSVGAARRARRLSGQPEAVPVDPEGGYLPGKPTLYRLGDGEKIRVTLPGSSATVSLERRKNGRLLATEAGRDHGVVREEDLGPGSPTVSFPSPPSFGPSLPDDAAVLYVRWSGLEEVELWARTSPLARARVEPEASEAVVAESAKSLLSRFHADGKRLGKLRGGYLRLTAFVDSRGVVKRLGPPAAPDDGKAGGRAAKRSRLHAVPLTVKPAHFLKGDAFTFDLGEACPQRLWKTLKSVALVAGTLMTANVRNSAYSDEDVKGSLRALGRLIDGEDTVDDWSRRVLWGDDPKSIGPNARRPGTAVLNSAMSFLFASDLSEARDRLRFRPWVFDAGVARRNAEVVSAAGPLPETFVLWMDVLGRCAFERPPGLPDGLEEAGLLRRVVVRRRMGIGRYGADVPEGPVSLPLFAQAGALEDFLNRSPGGNGPPDVAGSLVFPGPGAGPVSSRGEGFVRNFLAPALLWLPLGDFLSLIKTGLGSRGRREAVWRHYVVWSWGLMVGRPAAAEKAVLQAAALLFPPDGGYPKFRRLMTLLGIGFSKEPADPAVERVSKLFEGRGVPVRFRTLAQKRGEFLGKPDVGDAVISFRRNGPGRAGPWLDILVGAGELAGLLSSPDPEAALARLTVHEYAEAFLGLTHEEVLAAGLDVETGLPLGPGESLEDYADRLLRRVRAFREVKSRAAAASPKEGAVKFQIATGWMRMELDVSGDVVFRSLKRKGKTEVVSRKPFSVVLWEMSRGDGSWSAELNGASSERVSFALLKGGDEVEISLDAVNGGDGRPAGNKKVLMTLRLPSSGIPPLPPGGGGSPEGDAGAPALQDVLPGESLELNSLFPGMKFSGAAAPLEGYEGLTDAGRAAFFEKTADAAMDLIVKAGGAPGGRFVVNGTEALRPGDSPEKASLAALIRAAMRRQDLSHIAVKDRSGAGSLGEADRLLPGWRARSGMDVLLASEHGRLASDERDDAGVPKLSARGSRDVLRALKVLDPMEKEPLPIHSIRPGDVVVERGVRARVVGLGELIRALNDVMEKLKALRQVSTSA